MNDIVLSTLGHTWIIDLDGTVFQHNGYKIKGEDSFLPGAKSFLQSIPEKDIIIFLTSREKQYKEQTEAFLKENGIRYEKILFNLPYGERILVNDKKPSGLMTAVAINLDRDNSWDIAVTEDNGL